MAEGTKIRDRIVIYGLLGIIILIFAGMLMPAISGSRKQARRAYHEGARAKDKESLYSVAVERKLIKRGELNLEVKDCQETLKEINKIVKDFSGFVVDSDMSNYLSGYKRGDVVLKVPREKFELCFKALKTIGDVEREKIFVEDVTEEYVDIESRLKNSYKVREKLQKILEEKAQEVKDIIAVEKELARVGEKIETIEGRKKYLDRQIELSTITVNFKEPRRIALSSINLANKCRETIGTSIETFVNVFYGAIVVIAALIPIAFWVGLFWFIGIKIKKFRSKSKK